MHGPLVDVEGYPRNDIDVHQVRQARQQIICLQNDHKALMTEIEKLMHQLHAETGSDGQTEQDQQQNVHNEDGSQEDQPSEIDFRVIVRVNHVAPGSPAEKAVSC